MRCELSHARTSVTRPGTRLKLLSASVSKLAIPTQGQRAMPHLLLSDRSPWGNEAADAEDPVRLNSYVVSQPACLAFFDTANALSIARARKGMGKSALPRECAFLAERPRRASQWCRLAGTEAVKVEASRIKSGHMTQMLGEFGRARRDDGMDWLIHHLYHRHLSLEAPR